MSVFSLSIFRTVGYFLVTVLFLVIISSNTTYAKAETGFSTLAKTLHPASTTAFKFHELPADGNKPVVILLGGGPGFSSWNLEPIQMQINNWGYATYLMDMLGIGENRQALNPTQPVLQQWIAQIHSLQQEVSPQQPVVLVSHSWGALMAMLYMRDYPEMVEKLILLNPVDPEKKAMAQLTEAIHQRNQQFQDRDWDDESAWENNTDVAVEDVERITLRQIQQVLPTYFLDYQLGQKYAAQFTTNDFNIDLNVQAWREYDAKPIDYDEINHWQSRNYFLECEQDYLMPFNLQAMQSKMPLQQVQIIEQCGHFPWIEQPQVFARHLQNFLQD